MTYNDTLDQENFAPPCHASDACAIDKARSEQPSESSRERWSEGKEDSDSEHKLVTTVKPGEQESDGRNNTTLEATEENSNGQELTEVVDEGGGDSDDSKADDEEREPERAIFLHHQVGGWLNDTVGKVATSANWSMSGESHRRRFATHLTEYVHVKDVEGHERDVVLILGSRELKIAGESSDVGVPCNIVA